MALVPNCGPFDFWWEVVGGSKWGLDETVVFREDKCETSHDGYGVGWCSGYERSVLSYVKISEDLAARRAPFGCL